MKSLLTTRDVAKIVGLKPITIMRKVNKGEIPAIKLGRQFRFDKNQIEQWISKNKIVEKQHILVIDDEKDICELLKIVLEREGYIVTAVSNGAEAIELISKSRYDLIFLDLGMPQVNGLEILDYIKSQAIDVGIIIITGYAEGAQIMTAAMEYSPLLIMKKPFSNKDIKDIAARFLDKSGIRSSLK